MAVLKSVHANTYSQVGFTPRNKEHIPYALAWKRLFMYLIRAVTVEQDADLQLTTNQGDMLQEIIQIATNASNGGYSDKYTAPLDAKVLELSIDLIKLSEKRREYPALCRYFLNVNMFDANSCAFKSVTSATPAIAKSATLYEYILWDAEIDANGNGDLNFEEFHTLRNEWLVEDRTNPFATLPCALAMGWPKMKVVMEMYVL
jgi:hypothetical protein